ncbi:MAG: hypothetical protein SOR95_08945 [Sutterella sp.]|mgnify:FL=1|nr:hypothetical protein [Sutterella sp.]
MGNETSMMIFCALMSAVEGFSAVLILGECLAFPVRHCLKLAWGAVLALLLGVLTVSLSLGRPELLLSLVAHRSSTFFPVALTAGITLIALVGYLWSHYRWLETPVTFSWALLAGVASLALTVTTANLLRLPWNHAWQSPWIVVTLVVWTLVGVAELGWAYVCAYSSWRDVAERFGRLRWLLGGVALLTSLAYLASVPHVDLRLRLTEGTLMTLLTQGAWLWLAMLGLGVVGPCLLERTTQAGIRLAFIKFGLILGAVMSFHGLVYRMGEI